MPDRVRVAAARKAAVREIRRRQRTCDTVLERIERRLFQLLDRKTMLDVNDMIDLADRFKSWLVTVNDFEKGIVDAMQMFQD